MNVSLTEFLLARIAEDEERAVFCSAGAGARWHLVENGREMIADETGSEVVHYDGVRYLSDAEFIVRHDPARVLAECTAKRQILERHVSSEDTRGVGQHRDGVWTPYCEYDSASWPCPDIADLAAVYADHPDYDEAWRA